MAAPFFVENHKIRPTQQTPLPLVAQARLDPSQIGSTGWGREFRRTRMVMEKRGRPTKYEEGIGLVVEERMSQGFSKTAAAGFIGVCKTTLDTWCAEHPDFLGAVKRGETKRTLFLEESLLKAPDGPTVTSRIFALKNAAPDEWREKQIVEHGGVGGNPIEVAVTKVVRTVIDPKSDGTGD